MVGLCFGLVQKEVGSIGVSGQFTPTKLAVAIFIVGLS